MGIAKKGGGEGKQRFSSPKRKRLLFVNPPPEGLHAPRRVWCGCRVECVSSTCAKVSGVSFGFHGYQTLRTVGFSRISDVRFVWVSSENFNFRSRRMATRSHMSNTIFFLDWLFAITTHA